MTVDPFTDRVAHVRQRFVTTVEAKIEGTRSALAGLGGLVPGAAEAVATAYRSIHGIVGIGRTVGFPAIGNAARDVEDVLREPYQVGRGLTADELQVLTKNLDALREIAARELQNFHSRSK